MPIVIHNAGFDHPRVAKDTGVDIPREHVIDAMDAFHFLYNAFKRKLGFAGSLLKSCHGIKMWKHLAHTEPEYYSVVDALVALREHYETQALIDSTGARAAYTILHTNLDPALHFMSKTGMLAHRPTRAKLSEKLHLDLDKSITVMNQVVPDEIKSPHVWSSLKNAEKGKQTLLGKADSEEERRRLEVAEFFVVPGTKKVTSCGKCGILGIKADHTTRKFLKETTHAETQPTLFGEAEAPVKRRRQTKTPKAARTPAKAQKDTE